ncbi:hypothetical protein FB451DRAFT_401222 [Mycena latifolia]|nr:hypothetical protein FB451DRAFT_401222 [Mycena latifolia]
MLASRPLHLPAEGRLGTKTPGRENAIHRGAMTVHGKGKSHALAPQPHTVQPQRLVKDAFSAKNPTRLVVRPLGDKTPFPNRNNANAFATPLPGEQKLAKLVLDTTSAQPHAHANGNANGPMLLHPGATPDSVARPSSTRKHVRAPRNSFVTPITAGNHWESTPFDEVDLAPVAAEPEQAPAPEDDYDEIEYMPPNTLDTPYTPPFDFPLPDYAAVGASLLRRAHSYPYSPDDAPPPVLEPALDACACDMPRFALPELQSDDPFVDVPAPTMTKARTAASRPGTAARPGTVASRQASVRTVSGANKPLVAAASRKPLASAANKPPAAAAARKPLASSQVPASAASSNVRAAATSTSVKPLVRPASTKPPATIAAAARRPLVTAAARKPLVTAAVRKPLMGTAAASRRPLSTRAPAPAPSPEAILVAGPETPAEDDFLFDV